MIMNVITLAIEFFGSLLPALLTVAIVDLILLALAIANIGSSLNHLGRAISGALGVGAVVAVIALLLLPWATHAGWGNLQNAVDYTALVLIAVGLGLAAAAATFPPLQFLFGLGSESKRRDGKAARA
ncbi:MAG: hypothetical protein ACOC1T_00295 [Halorhodospira sp.]